QLRHRAQISWKRTNHVRRHVACACCNGCGWREDVEWRSGIPTHDSADLPLFDETLDQSRSRAEVSAVRSECKFPCPVAANRIGSMEREQTLIQPDVSRIPVAHRAVRIRIARSALPDRAAPGVGRLIREAMREPLRELQLHRVIRRIRGI